MREDHEGVWATGLVVPKLVLHSAIAVLGNHDASQSRLAGDDLGVLALLADEGDVRGFVLHNRPFSKTPQLCRHTYLDTQKFVRIFHAFQVGLRGHEELCRVLTLGFDEAVTIPGILTRRETCSDCTSKDMSQTCSGMLPSSHKAQSQAVQ